MALFNWLILVSIIRGGGGGLQFDFTRRLLGVGASSVSPAKKILRLKSQSNRSSVVVCSSGEVLLFGVEMNLRPSPSSVLAIGGRMLPVVRLCVCVFDLRLQGVVCRMLGSNKILALSPRWLLGSYPMAPSVVLPTVYGFPTSSGIVELRSPAKRTSLYARNLGTTPFPNQLWEREQLRRG